MGKETLRVIVVSGNKGQLHLIYSLTDIHQLSKFRGNLVPKRVLVKEW